MHSAYPVAAILAVAGAGPLAAATYTDGTFTGPSVDAYWGNLQVQVSVTNGQIANLTILRYPSDRRESQQINQRALPLLRTEAIKAQNASVNAVSGATLTSQAFVRSLQSALSQAGGPPATNGPVVPTRPGSASGGSIGI